MILPHLPVPGMHDNMPVLIPVGAVIAFAGKIAAPGVDPEKQHSFTTMVESLGWMVCDGRPLRKEDYGALYAVIGDQYKLVGEMDDEFFRIPDYRGYFLRMVTMNTDTDPDAKKRKLPDDRESDEVGSIQEDAMQWHQHQYTKPGSLTQFTGDKGPNTMIKTDEVLTGDPTNNLDKLQNTVRCSIETRAKNVYVYYLIKFIT